MGPISANQEPAPDLFTSPQLQRLRRLRPARFLLALSSDWAIIIAAIAAAGYADHAVGYAVAAFVIGTRQHALSILFHDGIHGLACANRRLNRLLTNLLCGWPLFAVADGYGPWHLLHHRHLGTSDDPELTFRRTRPYRLPLTRPMLAGLFLGELAGLGGWGLLWLWYVILPARRLRLVGPTLLWAGAIGALYWADLLWVGGLWIAAMATSFVAVFHIRTLSEHTGLTAPGARGTHRFVPGYIARFLFFPHNTWCHYEHHRWPFIPFANLPAVRAFSSEGDPITAGVLFASFGTAGGLGQIPEL